MTALEALVALRERVKAWPVDPEWYDPRPECAERIDLAVSALTRCHEAGPRHAPRYVRDVRKDRLVVPVGTPDDLRAMLDEAFAEIGEVLEREAAALDAIAAELPPPAPKAPLSPTAQLDRDISRTRNRAEFHAVIKAYHAAHGFPEVQQAPGRKVWGGPFAYYKEAMRYFSRNSNWTLFRDEVGYAFKLGHIRHLGWFEAFFMPPNPRNYLHPEPPDVNTVLDAFRRRGVRA